MKPESVEWVYTGSSRRSASDRFAADAHGDARRLRARRNSIIESAVGIGIGAYGSVRGNAMLPPVGSAIELVVQAAPAAK